jgi:hypothetical protein
MHRPKRMIPFALACALLALSGCARGGDENAADGGGAAPADSAAGSRVAACTPPPPVPFDTVSGQPWAPVAQYLSGRSFTPPGRKTKVRLCRGPNCVLVASIQSDNATNCLSNPGTDNQLRLLGIVVAVNGTDAPRLGFTPENTGDTVYLLSKAGKGYSLYRNGTNNTTQWVPNTAGSGWQFNFCDDGRQHPHASARWKKYDGGGSVAAPRDTLGGDIEDPTEIATGWMACVNGCCRFYGSPPPGGGMGAEPDTLKGGQQGQGGNAPVCPDTLP